MDLNYSGLKKKLLSIAHLLLKFCDGRACLPHPLQHPERAARLLYLPLQQSDLLTDRCSHPPSASSSTALLIEIGSTDRLMSSVQLRLRQKHAHKRRGGKKQHRDKAHRPCARAKLLQMDLSHTIFERVKHFLLCARMCAV